MQEQKAKKTFAPMKVDMQFTETHTNLYLELRRDFTKIDYAPQSEASLQNFQTVAGADTDHFGKRPVDGLQR
jgi:hypothetical protein